MRRLAVYDQISLDGFFVDANGDMGFARPAVRDAEWDAFGSDNASGGGALVFGRVTYDLMAGFWPTAAAAQQMPVIAERMNALPKIVFSRTLTEAAWRNTRLVKGDAVVEMKKLKSEPGPGMTILGSGSIVAQLAPHRLIDEYQIVVIPVVLGSGRALFDGVREKLPLKLTSTRTFANGNVLLCYQNP